MSSNAYFAELSPDPALRRIVQWSTVAIALSGVIAIGGLALPLALRIGGIAFWSSVVAAQFFALRRGWSTCVAFRVYADGTVTVLRPDGEWVRGRLEPDGVLLRRWGWIRLRAGVGQPFAEPLRGACRECRDWRRLQVVWRHVGA